MTSPAPGTAAPPNPEQRGDGEVEDHESEYVHTHMPLEPRELTDSEKIFLRHSIDGDLEAMQHMFTHGAVGDIDCQDQWGSTPLMHAAFRKHIPIVQWLLTNGADINKQDYRGITVLMEACWNCKVDMARLFLKAGANVNLCDERDYTALMQAAEEGHVPIVQLLIDAKADLNKQEKKRSYTSLMWAVVEGHPNVVQSLVQHGADLNLQDKYGFTALMQAARTRFLAAVLLLVGQGADLEVKDKKGRSVYDLGNQQVIQAMEKGKRDLRRRYVNYLQNDPVIATFQSETIAILAGYLIHA